MDEIIARINELARKVKAGQELTPEETEERAKLRRMYIDSVVGNLKGELDNTTIVYPDGSKKKVTHK
jgi:uncharacterized protein YnzC (UPF0291/DUF896 family)